MKKGVLSIILCLAMIITSCGTIRAISSAKAKPVRLNASKKSLKVGKKYQLKVKKAKGVTIKKKSFTKKGGAISVSKKGKVTAKKSGKATVQCKVKYKVKGKKKIYKKTLKCKITVSGGVGTEVPDPGQDSAPSASQETQLPSAEGSGAPAAKDSGAPGDVSQPPEGSGESGDVSQPPKDSGAPGDVSQPPEGSGAPGDVSQPPEGSGAPGDVSQPPEGSGAPGETGQSPEGSGAPGETGQSPEGSGAPGDTSQSPEDTASPTDTEEPSATPAPDYPSVEFNDAFEFIKDMGVGINLGNTMEACGDWINSSSPSNYEIAWQPDETKTKTTPAVIQGMRDAGFKTLRIPVAWSNMMVDDGTYTINEAYFNRIDEIIGYALDAGMYTIVNIHWDGGWWEQFGSNDETERQEAMKKYKAMWTQLAEHYKDYSNMLIFESANEELGPGLSPILNDEESEENGKLIGYYKDEYDLYDLTNEINQTFVNIVRGSGGKNVDRYLLIAGYNTDIGKTCDSYFEMPTDTITDHLMVSVHYYTPSDYCLGDTSTWGTAADIQKMKSDLSKMKLYYTSQGIPAIIGEYGVVSSKQKSGRCLYFQTLCEYALANGMCPILWEDSGLVYKRSTASMIYEDEAKLYLELAEKAESMDVFVPTPNVGDGGYSWSGTLSADGSGWNFLEVADSLDNNMVLSAVGGSYKLVGVDWSKYSSPKLEIKASGLDETITVGLATKLNTTYPGWSSMEVEKAVAVSSSSGVAIDLSALKLSGTQPLYFVIVNGDKANKIWEREDFSGDFTLRITE